MKKMRLYLFVIISLHYVHVFSQNVGINATGATADASAMLDIASSSKGLLIPRIALTSTTDVSTVSSPTTSLLVYNTATAGTSPNNVIPGYYYYTGTSWVPITSPSKDVVLLTYDLAAGTDDGAPVATTWTTRAINTEVSDPNGICTLASNQFTLPAGTYYIYFAQNYMSHQGVSIQFRSRLRDITNGTTIAMANTGDLEIANGHSLSRDVIGTTVFSTCASTTFALQYYAQNTVANGLGYSELSSGESERYVTVFIKRIDNSSIIPNTPVATAASVIGFTNFTANWATSLGASAYFLDVATDAAFTSMVTGYNNLSVGGVTSYAVTGLSLNTTYYYRVRAITACSATQTGNSNTITQTTNWCGSTLTVAHVSGTLAPETKTVTYGTVSTNLSGSTKCWITQNLGATNQGSSATDATDASAGWYWQFNRKRGYMVGPSPAWTITAINENSDWLAAQDPCLIELGTNWRIPTNTEWVNADANGVTGGWDNYTETFNDVLKLHASGYLTPAAGVLTYRGSYGDYWSSTQSSNTDGFYFGMLSTVSTTSNLTKAYGFSLRCIKD